MDNVKIIVTEIREPVSVHISENAQQPISSLEPYLSFGTTLELADYLGNPLRYNGQIATCKQTPEVIYVMNESLTGWTPLDINRVVLSADNSVDFTGAFISVWDTRIVTWKEYSPPGEGYDYSVQFQNYKKGIFWEHGTWASEENQVNIPIFKNWLAELWIDWGDGSVEYWGVKSWFYTNHGGWPIHTYDTPGKYTIRIKGDFVWAGYLERWDRVKLWEITQWGCWKSAQGNGDCFYNCQNMDCSALDEIDMTGIQNFFGMFYRCDRFNWPGASTMNTTGISQIIGPVILGFSFNQPVYWDIQNVASSSFMLIFVPTEGYSPMNYDATLQHLANQLLHPNVQYVDFVGARYTQSGKSYKLVFAANHPGVSLTDYGPTYTESIQDVVIYNMSMTTLTALLVVKNQSGEICTSECTFSVSDPAQLQIGAYGLVNLLVANSSGVDINVYHPNIEGVAFTRNLIW